MFPPPILFRWFNVPPPSLEVRVNNDLFPELCMVMATGLLTFVLQHNAIYVLTIQKWSIHHGFRYQKELTKKRRNDSVTHKLNHTAKAGALAELVRTIKFDQDELRKRSDLAALDRVVREPMKLPRPRPNHGPFELDFVLEFIYPETSISTSIVLTSSEVAESIPAYLRICPMMTFGCVKVPDDGTYSHEFNLLGLQHASGSSPITMRPTSSTRNARTSTRNTNRSAPRERVPRNTNRSAPRERVPRTIHPLWLKG